MINRNRASRLFKKFEKQRILVVGDLMLDRYIYGVVDRISPEAPVPIVHVQRETRMPGGASNVAWNIQSLGAQSSVAGIIGKDIEGRELKKVLRQDGVDVGGVSTFASQRTTTKMRIIAERQQVVRVDFEERHRLSKAMVSQFKRNVIQEIRKSTGIIIEDYGKGVIRQEVLDVILEESHRCGIPVGLDPKDDHELVFNGISVATPNRKEAFTIAGIKDGDLIDNPLEDKKLKRVGELLVEKWQADFLMITLGPHGIYLVSNDESPRHVPTRAREVFDVSGAGDTVIATCVTALAAGASYLEAAELANYAAGVVVGKIGTAVCTKQELLDYLP